MNTFPTGYKITNIKPGSIEAGRFPNKLYANLEDSNGVLIISGTLDFITQELNKTNTLCFIDSSREQNKG